MGLDMYLYLKKYESLGSWKKDFETKKKNFYPKELKSFGNEISQHNFMSKETRYQVGYWCKFNALHNYMVKNFAGGVDECQPIYISVTKLKELHLIIKRVIGCKFLAKDLLPTQEGFFFGSTEYDDYYFEDLKYTCELLEKVINFLENNTDYSVCYQASW